VDKNSLIAALVPVIVIFVGFAVYCVVDVLRAERTKHLPKWAWLVICLVSIPMGGVLYLLLGRVSRDR
jgi:predicted ABC-type exoprotein transport system permease subunit